MYYEPEVGSYISQDPIRLAGGMHLYSYVHNPNRWLDVFGLEGNVYIFGKSDARPRVYDSETGKWKGDIIVDGNGMVKAQAADIDNGVFPQGKSATVDYNNGLTGKVNEIKGRLPEGLAMVKDGSDVTSLDGAHAKGHVTIYPTEDMSFDEFIVN